MTQEIQGPEGIGETQQPIEKFGISIPPLPESDLPIVSPDLNSLPLSQEYILPGIKHDLQKSADSIAVQANQSGIIVSESPEEVEGDYGFPTFKLVKHFRKPPVEIALDLADEINGADQPNYVERSIAEGPYLNFKLDRDRVSQDIITQIEQMGERYGEQNVGNGDVVVIDCSSPNIAKHMSVGHLRSTVIGESLSRIYKSAGHTVIRDNHLGDWGTQFGMLGRAVDLWGDEIPNLRDGGNSVEGLYQLYVRMNTQIADDKQALKTSTGIEDPETDLEKEGRAWFQRLENGDPEALELWKWSMGQSLAEFNRVYNLLGVDFEYMLGESQYLDMLPHVVRSFQEQGISHVDEKGRVAVDLSDRNLNPLVIQKSDGTSLYQTRDLATLVARDAWFDPAKILYVVGGDQRDYFKQVFAAHEKLAGDEAPVVEHVSFGMVTLPEGKMSTRRGRVVFLEDVINESISRAESKIRDSQDGHDRGLDDEQIAETAKQIGVGAVIYSDLGQGRERDIKFDLEQALSFEGNSGPYLQYAHARANAILRKAEESGIEIDQGIDVRVESPQETELVKQLGRYPEAIPHAISDNQPSIVAAATFQTAERFNKFYNSTPVLAEENPDLRNSRLRVTKASAQVIRNGLNLLGMKAPDVM